MSGFPLLWIFPWDLWVKAGVGGRVGIRMPLPIPQEHDLGQLTPSHVSHLSPLKRYQETFRTSFGADVIKTTSVSQYPPTEMDCVSVQEWLGKQSIKGDPSGRGGKMNQGLGETGARDHSCRFCPAVLLPSPAAGGSGGAAVQPGRRENALPGKPASHPATAAGLQTPPGPGGRELVWKDEKRGFSWFFVLN